MNLNTERNIQTIGNTPRIKPTERQTLGVVQNTNQVQYKKRFKLYRIYIQGTLREITDVQETITSAPIADMEPIDACQTEQNQFKKSGFESYGIQTEVAEKFTTKLTK